MRSLLLTIHAGLLTFVAQAQHPLPEQLPINTPFVSSPPQFVDAMLRLASVGNSDLVYDLGCGDGRIVISAARSYGARGVGIDNNPTRIQEAQANSRVAGVAGRVNFQLNDLFDADIHRATVVALYLLPDVNIRLRSRLQHELKPGTRVISHTFGMGDWKPDKEMLVDGVPVYLWTIR
jgi:cyclopropane fatty-acyl-phospholipid synthase-like methyltransferase